MGSSGQYVYLKPKRGSRYRQLFVNGRIMVEIIYRATIGQEARSPAEVADDYGIPVEAVQEAIDYAKQNPQILDADRAMEQASIQAHGLDRWPYAPKT
jgi:uncharacterized protein (DUF433 family)